MIWSDRVLDYKDSVALVTGGNRGIGAAVSVGLAAKGIHVIVGSRNLVAGRDIVEKIRSSGGSSEVIELDVQSSENIKIARRQIEKEHRYLNILVNNAGILKAADRQESMETLDIGILEETMDVNVYGVFRMIQAFLPMLRKAPWGRIVSVTSGLGNLSDSMTGGYSAYRISKTALNALTANLAAEVRKDGILVNCVHPGWVKTDMGGTAAPLTPENGADSIIYAATLPSNGPTGKYIAGCRVLPF